VAQSVLVAECPTNSPAFNRSLNVGAVNPASKGQRSARLRPEQDVLLIDGSLQLPFLARTLVMTCDRATVLRELHDLCSLDAVRPSGVDCPVAGDIGRRLLRDRDVADHEQQKRETEKKQLRAVFLHRISSRSASDCTAGAMVGREAVMENLSLERLTHLFSRL